jgi:hypothetical protein
VSSKTPGANLRRHAPPPTSWSEGRRRRAPWLLAALTLAIGPGVLLPSAALASRQRPRAEAGAGAFASRACRVQLEVTPSRLTAGESATASGSLICPSSPAPGEQTVTLYSRSAGSSAFSALATATSQASGAFRLTTEPLQSSEVLYARAADGRSAPVLVHVATAVTISGPPTGTPLAIVAGRGTGAAHATNTLTFTGTVAPAQTGATVVLEREGAIEENWMKIATGEVGEDGRYSITHTFGIPGTATVRVVAHDPGLLRSASEPLTYQIARRQNPLLTIQASARPLVSGQQLTVSGTAACAESGPLTLLAGSGAGALALVATTTCENGGSYTFAPQAPTQNTVYEVKDARTSSTRLLDDVRPLLAVALPTPASVQDGETVAFSGTVTPVRAGQVVQLQRQDPEGLGFAVIETAIVEAGGSFTIAHTVSGASGTHAFRIVVPASADMAEAASKLLDVQVTRPAAGSIEPEAPAGSLGES